MYIRQATSHRINVPVKAENVTESSQWVQRRMIASMMTLPFGIRGCDCKTSTTPIGAVKQVGIPPTVVESLPVHLRISGA